MSILGFSFGFGAVDQGLRSALDAAGSGVDRVSDALGKVGDSLDLSSTMDAFNALSLSNISGQLEAISGGAIQLTNSLESTFTSLNKEVAPVVAQMGYIGAEAGKQASKIASLAHSLNVSGGAVAKTFKAMEQAGKDTSAVLKEAGLDMKTLVKAEAGGILETEAFVAAQGGLVDSWKFGSKELKSFNDAMAKTAAVTKTGDTAFNSLGKTLSIIDTTMVTDEKFNSLSKEVQAMKIQDMATGVLVVNSAFRDLGMTGAEAQEKAQEFFKTFMSERKNLSMMAAGVGEFSDLFKGLARESGFKSIDDMLMSKAPDEMLKSLLGMQKGMETKQLQRFKDKMEAIVPGFGYLSDGGTKAAKTMTKMRIAAEKSTTSFNKVSKAGYKSGRTLQESYELAEAAHDSRLRKMAGGNKGFLKLQKETFKQSEEFLGKFANSSEWGTLTKMFIRARDVGIQSFFQPIKHEVKATKKLLGDLRKPGEDLEKVFGELAPHMNMDKAAKSMKALDEQMKSAQIVANMEAMADKTSLFGGRIEAVKRMGLAGFFMDLSAAVGTDKEGFAEAQKEAGKKSTELLTKLTAIKDVVKQLTPAFVALGAALATIFIVTKLAGPLLALVGVLKAVGIAVAAVVGWPILIAVAVTAAVLAFASLPEETKKAIDEWFGTAGNWLQGVADKIGNIDWTAATEKIVAKIKTIPTVVWATLNDAFAETSDGEQTGLASFGTGLWAAIAASIRAVGDIAVVVGSAILEGLGAAWDYITGEGLAFDLMNLFPKAEKWGDVIGQFFFGIGDEIGKFFDELDWDAVGTGFIDGIVGAIFNIVLFLAAATKFLGRVLAGIVKIVWEVFRVLATVIGKAILLPFKAIGMFFASFGKTLWGWIKDAFFWAVDQFSQLGTELKDGFRDHVWDPLTAWLPTAMTGISDWLDDTIMKPLGKIGEWLAEKGNMIAGPFVEYVWDPLIRFFSGAGDAVGGFFDDYIIEPMMKVVRWFTESPLYKAFKDYIWNPITKFFGKIANFVGDFFNDWVLKPFQKVINGMIRIADNVAGIIGRSTGVKKIKITMDRASEDGFSAPEVAIPDASGIEKYGVTVSRAIRKSGKEIEAAGVEAQAGIDKYAGLNFDVVPGMTAVMAGSRNFDVPGPPETLPGLEFKTHPFGAVKDAPFKSVASMMGDMGPIAEQAGGSISLGVASGITKYAPNALESAMGMATGMMNIFPKSPPEDKDSPFMSLYKVGPGIIDMIGESIMGSYDYMVEVMQKAFGGLPSAISQTIGLDTGLGMVNGIQVAIYDSKRAFMDAGKFMLLSVIEGIRNFKKSFETSIVEILGSSIKAGFGDIGGSVGDSFRGLAGKLEGPLVEEFRSLGKRMAPTFIMTLSTEAGAKAAKISRSLGILIGKSMAGLAVVDGAEGTSKTAAISFTGGKGSDGAKIYLAIVKQTGDLMDGLSTINNHLADISANTTQLSSGEGLRVRVME